ncbi:MAG: type 4a pilus biogenesis protein PilO [Bdellovibrionota bacterium]
MALEADLKQALDKALKLPVAARVGVLAAFYVLVVVIYYVAFYLDQVKVLEQQTKAFEQIHAKLVQTQNIASQIDTFIEEVEQLKEKLAQAQDQLPPDARMDVLIEQVTRLGKDNGLRFTKITPKNETSQGFYALIPIDFEMAGKYHAFGLFFSELAAQSRIMNVQGLKLAREKNESNELKASFTVNTYRAIEQAIQKSGDGKQGAAPAGKGAEGMKKLSGGGADEAKAVH